MSDDIKVPVANTEPELPPVEKVHTRAKDVPWYAADIQNIDEPARRLLEDYSHVPPEKVTSHLLDVRERAWDVFPYPCIGQFRFLDLSIARAPKYSTYLERINQGQKLLDLGCCFGQDVRKIVADGAPSDRIYGAELRREFVEMGYELFLDKETLKTKFLVADVFDDDSELKQLYGQIDLIHTASFLHLFDWQDQVRAACRMVQVLKTKPGSTIFGRQMGSRAPADYNHRTNGGGKMFRHDPASFQKMWDEVGEKTGSSWKVHAEWDPAWSRDANAQAVEGKWMDKDAGRLNFEVVRE